MGTGAWRLITPPSEFHLQVEGNERPPGLFWPELSPKNTEAWSVGDPSAIKLTSKGVSLEQGADGNFLLTKRQDFKKSTLKITLAPFDGSEAYLALHARQGPDAWHAVTSRIVCRGGKAYAGATGFDFQQEHGQPLEKPAGKPFMIRFDIDDNGTYRAFVGNQQTSSISSAGPRPAANAGSVGLFVKSGRVLIESLRVE
jgi:hypothetical protein